MKLFVALFIFSLPIYASDQLVTVKEFRQNFSSYTTPMTIKGTLVFCKKSTATSSDTFYVKDSTGRFEITPHSVEAANFFNLANAQNSGNTSKSLTGPQFLFTGTGLKLWINTPVSSEIYLLAVSAINPVKKNLLFSKDSIVVDHSLSSPCFSLLNISADTIRIDSLLVDTLPFVEHSNPGFILETYDTAAHLLVNYIFAYSKIKSGSQYSCHIVSETPLRIPPKTPLQITYFDYWNDWKATGDFYYLGHSHGGFTANVTFCSKNEQQPIYCAFNEYWPTSIIRGTIKSKSPMKIVSLKKFDMFGRELHNKSAQANNVYLIKQASGCNTSINIH